jgi:predicted ATPase
MPAAGEISETCAMAFSARREFLQRTTEIEKLDDEPAFGPPIINSYGFRSLHEQSHGESFFALMQHRFGGQGFTFSTNPRRRCRRRGSSP